MSKKKPEDVQEIEAKGKIINNTTNHFKKHWWKYCLLILSIGISLSGFECQDGDKKIKKEAVKLPGIGKVIDNEQ